MLDVGKVKSYQGGPHHVCGQRIGTADEDIHRHHALVGIILSWIVAMIGGDQAVYQNKVWP